MHEVEFTYYRPDAREVYLLGDFNGWDATSLPMQPASSGNWVMRLMLKPGSYLYRYLVRPAREDQWLSEADEWILGFEWSTAGANSVVLVGAGSGNNETPPASSRKDTEPSRGFPAGRRADIERLRVNEQEQDLLRCFRMLQDDHIRSDMLHFMRDFVRFGPPDRVV